jgi:RNA polymerase sigma-70 factor (ECF subfamily)
MSVEVDALLERHRPQLTAYCNRMLGSAFEAEDAVQETLLRAWRGFDRFEGRAALRSWLYRIATNVTLDMLRAKQRTARPEDLGPTFGDGESPGDLIPDATWIQPVPDPAEVAETRERVRIAFMAALRHLPARQRAVFILRDVLSFRAAEVAEFLDTTATAVNSALQRARSTLAAGEVKIADQTHPVTPGERALVARHVDALERYDLDSLASLNRMSHDGMSRRRSRGNSKSRPR